MNDLDIRQTWAYLAELWPSYRLPETVEQEEVRLAAWRDVLGDLDPSVVRPALASVADRDFPPTAGQVRAAADALVARATGDQAPDTDVAWAEVKRAVHRYGTSWEPRWSHPAIEAAVQAMGWRDFCASAVEAEGTWRAHFLRFYGSAAVRNDRQVGVGPAPAVAALAQQLRADRALGTGDGG